MGAVAPSGRDRVRGTRLAALALAGTLLAACALPPPPVAVETPRTADPVPVAPSVRSAPLEAVPDRSRFGLKPLTPQLAVPAGVAPRSMVSSELYDLSTPIVSELPWDDGVPGDSSRPREEMERGGASWYGIQFHQRKTANGERFDMGAMTAAHKTLPFNTHVCVRSLVNGREVMVRINDRGPYAAGRVIDLSRAAADSIGMLGLGIKPVALSVLGKGQRCGGESLAANAPEPVSTVRPVAPPRRGKAVVHPRQRR